MRSGRWTTATQSLSEPGLRRPPFAHSPLDIDRKVLADMAGNDEAGFKAVAAAVRKAVEKAQKAA